MGAFNDVTITNRKMADLYQRYWGGDDLTCGEILSHFLPCGEILFCQKRGFFENFRDTSTQITPKITFYCIFVNKFHKNFEKSAKNFFAAHSAPKMWRNAPIFSARVWKIHPSPFEGSPPKCL